MTEANETRQCFNCGRTHEEIPIIAWTYREAELWVCCECMPRLIHKWAEVVQTLHHAPAE